MKELEEFFKDVKRIADGIEAMVKMYVEEIEKIAENSSVITSAFDIPEAVVKAPIETIPQTPTVATAIPVSTTVQTYTQEQLAVAMGRAIDAGKSQEIQAILGSFGVSSLVEIKAENYNDLVMKLKGIGVDV